MGLEYDTQEVINMPREARKKSKTGIYHILLRGQNKQIIFQDNEDYMQFLQVLNESKAKSDFQIYAYCLMDNHIHLLLHEFDEEIGTVMRRIGSSYVYRYNWKYRRCGHLFQDRFKSEEVETDAYFLTALRYIHNNPVKANITNTAANYRWSSYNEYLNKTGITDTDFALNIFGDSNDKAIVNYMSHHEQRNEDRCLELDEHLRLNDEEALDIIKTKCLIENSIQLKEFEREKRDYFIKLLKKEGLSSRQLERLTGIKRSIILKS